MCSSRNIFLVYTSMYSLSCTVLSASMTLGYNLYESISFFSFLNRNTVGIQCYISFWCLTQWFDNSIQEGMLIPSAGTTQIHYNIINYVPCGAPFVLWLIHSTSLYFLVPFTTFAYLSNNPLPLQAQVCSLYIWFCFCVLFILLDCTSWKHLFN